jgi:hypothetical protein
MPATSVGENTDHGYRQNPKAPSDLPVISCKKITLHQARAQRRGEPSCARFTRTSKPRKVTIGLSLSLCVISYPFVLSRRERGFDSRWDHPTVRLKQFQPHAGVGVQLNISELPSSFTDCAPSFLPFIVPVS